MRAMLENFDDLSADYTFDVFCFGMMIYKLEYEKLNYYKPLDDFNECC